MKKIKTIFDRDWKGNHKCIDKYINDMVRHELNFSKATEKVDGTNIRLTIRNEEVVRIEKRKNPTKVQKQIGIENPWYVDVDKYASEDKWIYDAVKSRDYKGILEGEWSAEAFGKNIQGNPINMFKNSVYLFSCGEALEFKNCPTTFDELKEWLPKQKSLIGDGIIEGIVWHCNNGNMYKIKNKDFK